MSKTDITIGRAEVQHDHGANSGDPYADFRTAQQTLISGAQSLTAFVDRLSYDMRQSAACDERDAKYREAASNFDKITMDRPRLAELPQWVAEMNRQRQQEGRALIHLDHVERYESTCRAALNALASAEYGAKDAYQRELLAKLGPAIKTLPGGEDILKELLAPYPYATTNADKLDMARWRKLIAEARSRAGAHDDGSPFTAHTKTFDTETDPASLEPEDYIYGKVLTAGEVSMIAAAGGTGKTFRAVMIATAIAAGATLDKNSGGVGVVHKPGNVWFISEERESIIIKRLTACRHEYAEELPKGGAWPGRIYYNCLRDKPFIAALKDGDEVRAGRHVADAIAYIKREKVLLLVIDTLIRVHEGLNENSNPEMAALAKIVERIATETGCAVLVLHHTAKDSAGKTSKAADSNAPRGAGAIRDHVRVTLRDIEIDPDRDQFWKRIPTTLHGETLFRSSDGKVNNHKKGARPCFYWIKSVNLGNERRLPDGTVKPSDEVGVCRSFALIAEEVAAREPEALRGAIADFIAGKGSRIPGDASRFTVKGSAIVQLVMDVLHVEKSAAHKRLDELLPDKAIVPTIGQRVKGELRRLSKAGRGGSVVTLKLTEAGFEPGESDTEEESEP